MLTAQGVSVRYGNKTVVSNISFSLHAGDWLMLTGPNGAGKSTLLSALSQCVPYEGQVLVDGQDARSMKPRSFARRVGVLSQIHHAQYAYTVEEVVKLGRYAHQSGMLSKGDPQGNAAVETALRDTGLNELRHKSVLALSGGELQRVFLAQVFAQQPAILLLDEPANHLDLVYQQQLFDMLNKWLAGGERALICVVHDLSLALRYGNRALLMNEGKAEACGDPNAVLSRERLQRVYGMDVHAWMSDTLGVWGTKEQIFDGVKEG